MDSCGKRTSNRHPCWTTLLLVCLGFLFCAGTLTFPGCSGCTETPQEREARLKKEEKEKEERERREREKKPPFEMTQPMTLPRIQTGNDFNTGYKSGHWTTLEVEAVANEADFSGELEIASSIGRQPAPLGAMPYHMVSERPAPLAKGTKKVLESVNYFPLETERTTTEVRLQRTRTDQSVIETGRSLAPMPSYQYYLVVLARWPERYQYLTTLDAISPASNVFLSAGAEPFYRLVLPPSDRAPPLPSQSSEWTSIACILWDDASAERILPDMQDALLDWLHWGGQLVVSGPDSLDSLPGSFLGPFLPAESKGTRDLTQSDFAEFNRQWTVPSSRIASTSLQIVKPISGVSLALRPGARFMPGCGSLVAERRVGRGRVVVSAFPLSGGQWTAWKGLDSFVNGVVLGRPARVFGVDAEELLAFKWVGEGRHPFDPAMTTHVRYFARDFGVSIEQYAPDLWEQNYDSNSLAAPQSPGLGAWNDFSPVSQAARLALKDTARIEIPRRDFVVWVVAGYLLVLVPLNWMVFRVLNRVEWAWIAAPLIAIGCTVLVIHLAQLDIGFVRSRSDVAVMEVQGTHPRCHLARYTALYSSLATPYRIASADRGLRVLPFPKVNAPDAFAWEFGQVSTPLAFRHQTAEGTELVGFRAASSSTEFLHSEQMIAPSGRAAPVAMVRSGNEASVVNRLPMPLHDAGVIRRLPGGLLETAWLGTLEAGASARLHFQARPDLEKPSAGSEKAASAPAGLQRAAWPRQRKGSGNPDAWSAKSAHLGQLIALAENPSDLMPGDVRLVGWLDAPLPGLSIEPAASQQQHFTLVLAHLEYGLGPAPQPDKQLSEDVTGPMADYLRRQEMEVLSPQVPGSLPPIAPP